MPKIVVSLLHPEHVEGFNSETTYVWSFYELLY